VMAAVVPLYFLIFAGQMAGMPVLFVSGKYEQPS